MAAGRGTLPAVSVTGALARCEQLLATLDIPVPLDVGEMCRRVATRRGRELKLFPQDTARDGLPSGLWADMPDRDELYYDAGTSPAHQDLIVLHELGHILFDHYPAGGLAAVIAAANPEVAGAAHRMLCRGEYGEQEELEAETFATLVVERYGNAATQPRPGDGDLAARLRSTFEG